jgi:hypothetical protein
MLKIDVRNVVHAIVEQELIRKGREGEALYVNFDLRMSHHTNNKSYDQSRGLHLLYQVNPGYTYVSVFSAVTDSPFATIREVEEWKHEVTHDSCWRDTNVFSQVYFDMAEKINAAMKADKRKPIAPKDMHEWHNLGRAGLFQWVKVNITKDPNDDRNYRKLVEVL